MTPTSLHPGLSPQWLRERTRVLKGIDTGVGSVTVQYRNPGEHGEHRTHFQHYGEAGDLLTWEYGSIEDPDLTLEQPEWATRALFSGEPQDDVLAATAVVEPSGGQRALALPPRDEIEVPVDLAPVPGASVVAQVHLSACAFGPACFWFEYVDGIRTAFSIGHHPDPIVQLDTSFDSYLRFRAGEISLNETIEDGGVQGDWPTLMLAAGLFDSPEYRRLLAAGSSRRTLHAVRTLSEILTSPNFLAARSRGRV
jgi:hypothetical protein